MRFGGRDQVHIVNADPKLDPADTAVQLYAAERQAGFSVLTNTIVLWIAATTYFTAAVGVLALMHMWDSTQTDTAVRAVPRLLLYWLPFPACALAGYHVILYDIQASHSQSIAILEKYIVNDNAPVDVKSYWEVGRIGSRAETDRTEWALDFRKIPIMMTGIVALLVPYVSAFLLTIFCLVNLHQVTGFRDWVYSLTVGLYISFGLSVISLGVQSTIFLLRKPSISQA